MNILITGGLGFIGINTALRLTESGHKVTLFDNLNKLGLLKYIDRVLPTMTNFIKGDIRNRNDVEKAFISSKYDAVFHLAAQTAVTCSVEDPVLDFENNVVGSFHILECVRNHCPEAKLIYSSTNKVYGSLTRRGLVEKETRYVFKDNINGINENEMLDFYSPYGCSKGAADQYIRDYARIYGLDTAVVRQSCIYGEYQDGTEDQGWVAWFVKAFLNDYPITIFGDGKQVRDILYIGDLVDFYEYLLKNNNNGEIYNLGGGMINSLSLLELIGILERKFNKKIIPFFSEERHGDQKIFISDNTKAEGLGWTPKVGTDYGLDKLISYLKGSV